MARLFPLLTTIGRSDALNEVNSTDCSGGRQAEFFLATNVFFLWASPYLHHRPKSASVAFP